MKSLRVTILLVLLAPLIKINGQEYLIKLSDLYIDGQKSPFNNVKPGDTVWLQSGTRSYLKMANFHGASGKPIVFANYNGQVIVDTDYNYGFSFSDCAYFKLTGIPGSGYKYGINITRVANPSGMGIAASNKSTNFEIENCEISDIGFAGVMTKTDPVCDQPDTFRSGFVQYNISIHDCFIHDVIGEGMYIGSSFYRGQHISPCDTTVLPSVIVGAQIFNNRIERTGLDGMQVSSVVSNCEIHHNVLIDCSYRMLGGQMNSILIGGGTKAKCYNNKIIDSYGAGILVFGKGGTEVFNNLILRAGKRYLPSDMEEPESAIFIADKSLDEKSFYGVYNNTIVQPKSDGITIDPSVKFPTYIKNNAIIDPGAYNHYENENNGKTGFDSYIDDLGNTGLYASENNFFINSLASAGFVNVAGDDFHLIPGSPLIDAGQDLRTHGVSTDLDDRSRPVGAKFDIGAYEYSASQSIEYKPDNADFDVSSICSDPSGTLTINLQGNRNMLVRIRVLDVLGRDQGNCGNFTIVTGTNQFNLPIRSHGLVILLIQSDRQCYASKIFVI